MPSFVVFSFISLKSLKLNRRINHKRNLSNSCQSTFFFLTDIFKMYLNVIYFITSRGEKKKKQLAASKFRESIKMWFTIYCTVRHMHIIYCMLIFNWLTLANLTTLLFASEEKESTSVLFQIWFLLGRNQKYAQAFSFLGKLIESRLFKRTVKPQCPLVVQQCIHM